MTVDWNCIHDLHIWGSVHRDHDGEICKRRFHCEDTSNVSRPHHAGGIWSHSSYRPFQICVWGRLEQGNHMVISTSSFLKSFVCKMFSVRTKTQIRRFQIPSVSRAFWRDPFSFRISVAGRPNRRNKAVFSWRISVEVRCNRRRKAAFSWRISVDRIGLTVETKLRFHISPTQCGPGLKIKILGWKFSIDRHYTFFFKFDQENFESSWCL